LNSTFHFLTSSTAFAMSVTTVPDFGDGIRPFGPSCLATGAKSLISSGVVINMSKLNFHSLISFRTASVPTRSAHAFLASGAKSSFTNTAIFFVFQVP
jgi:hypothetical protein